MGGSHAGGAGLVALDEFDGVQSGFAQIVDMGQKVYRRMTGPDKRC